MPKNAKPRSRCRKKTSVSNEDGEASSVALAAASETEASTSCHPVVANVGSNGDDPVPVAASIASKKKQRAKKTPFSLDVSEEEVMCDFLREHAMIWDIKKVTTAGWTRSHPVISPSFISSSPGSFGTQLVHCQIDKVMLMLQDS